MVFATPENRPTSVDSTNVFDTLSFEISNVIFLSHAALLIICSIFLVRILTFVSVMNGLFLFAAASFVVFLEIHQPKCIMKNIPFWNSCLCRGIVLVWMSVIAMEGVWFIGLIAFFLSIAIVIGHFYLNEMKILKPLLHNNVTLELLGLKASNEKKLRPVHSHDNFRDMKDKHNHHGDKIILQPEYRTFDENKEETFLENEF